MVITLLYFTFRVLCHSGWPHYFIRKLSWIPYCSTSIFPVLELQVCTTMPSAQLELSTKPMALCVLGSSLLSYILWLQISLGNRKEEIIFTFCTVFCLFCFETGSHVAKAALKFLMPQAHLSLMWRHARVKLLLWVWEQKQHFLKLP